MTERSAEILFISVTAARATSFMFSKMLLQTLAPFGLLGLRFLMAFALVALLFRKDLRSLNTRNCITASRSASSCSS